MPGTTLTPLPNAKLTFYPNDWEKPCDVTNPNIYLDTINGQDIASSHDPNFKTVLENDLCAGDSVTWRIDFQNEGNKAESKVVISDWIDTLFEYESVTLLSAQCKFPVSAIRYNPANREWRFEMTNISLRGLGERGVPEDSTKGYIVFRVKKRNQIRCNAAANNARILFGCNPPIFTKTALARFPCDSIINCDCVTLKEETLPILIGDTGTVVLSQVQFDSIFLGIPTPETWVYKWYPTAGLSNPLVAMPTLTGKVNRTYTLVASNPSSCNHIIVHVQVPPPTPLSLAASKTCSNNTWNITETASGRPATHLIWNTCATNTSSQSMSNVAGGQLAYFGVWDTMTDQVAEEWVLLPYECPTCIPPWVYAALLLIVAALVVRYFISRRR